MDTDISNVPLAARRRPGLRNPRGLWGHPVFAVVAAFCRAVAREASLFGHRREGERHLQVPVPQLLGHAVQGEVKGIHASSCDK